MIVTLNSPPGATDIVEKDLVALGPEGPGSGDGSGVPAVTVTTASRPTGYESLSSSFRTPSKV